MPATRPETAPLTGSVVRLEPMTREHLPDLYAAIGRPEVFAGGFGGGPAATPRSWEDFAAWAERAFRWDDGNVYLARLAAGVDAGAVVGTSTLADFDLAREHAHIGWTAWDPRVWGTAVNPEAKLLMLGLAFGNGFGRVKLQGDILNARSRAAMLKLGATFEGIVRRDIRRADGSWRDTAVYSILVDEWPAVRAGLEARIAALGPATLGSTGDPRD